MVVSALLNIHAANIIIIIIIIYLFIYLFFAIITISSGGQLLQRRLPWITRERLNIVDYLVYGYLRYYKLCLSLTNETHFNVLL